MRLPFVVHLLVVMLALSLDACGAADPPPPAADGGPSTDLGGRDARTACASDLDCNDGLFCNGSETCAPASAVADPRGCIAGAPPCAGGDSCAEDTDSCGACSTADADGDGVSECDGDCDDADATRFPGNAELCDTFDQDCNDATYGARDIDGDGSIDIRCCNATNCGPDCDDMRDTVHPGASEACDGLDNDCNGAVDDAALRTWYHDADHDGFGDTGMAMTAACAPVDYATVGGDCRDDVASINPGTAEVCNSLDDNCVGGIDEGVTMNYHADCDGDLYGDPDPGSANAACSRPVAPPTACPGGTWSLDVRDCDDGNSAIHPGAPEVCNAADDNCDGTADGATAETWCDAPAQRALLRAASATCAATGACAATSCASPYLDCTSTPGCELDGTADASNCGMCGHVCTWGACAASTCADAVEISTGEGHTCARRGSGAVVCWGYNDVGQLGSGTSDVMAHPTPGAVSGLGDAIEISVGSDQDGHTCARRASGAVVCWGYNLYGQLGDGTATERHTPVAVSGLADAVEISAGEFHTCARRASGAVVCWGRNLNGQLGDGTTTPQRSTPVAVSGLADAVEISAGLTHTCARRASGAVVCWGRNLNGQLGDGTTTQRYAPVAVSGLADAVEISSGVAHTCARRASGAVVCWGLNTNGQLGDGTVIMRSAPVAVSGLADAVELSAGGHTCARRASGAVVCWGANGNGQLGDGTTTQRSTPVAVSGLVDAVEISAGTRYTCTRRASGAVACWGTNGNGQLGDGTTTERHTPATVVAPT